MTNSKTGYQVLARRWRPQNFDELVGQEHVVRALINGLDNDRLHHAFLFTGTRGVGKTTIARIFAKALNCETGVTSSPCGQCGACESIKEGRFVDLIEVDAASRTGVDDMRELLANVQYRPASGRFKVYLVDEVHMLSTNSFNALLKTLEEPPEHVKFLFATTDPEKLPVTVLSRCLQFNLKHLPAEDIVAHLGRILEAESVDSEPDALEEIGRAARGSVRDALSILDQAIAYGGGKLLASEVRGMLGTLERGRVGELLVHAIDGDAEALLASIEDMAQYGPNYQRVLQELGELLHRVAMLQQVPTFADRTHAAAELVDDLAQRLAPDVVQLNYEIVVRGLRDLAFAPSARIGLEMTLLRILAFQPASHAPVAAPAGSAPAQSSAPKPRRTKPAAPAAESLESAAAEPGSSSAPVPATPPPQPESVEPAAPITPADWPSRIGMLALSGPARELASNCELMADSGDRMVLRLSPRLEYLRTPGSEKKLQQGLSMSLGRDVALNIELRDGDGVTPAAAHEQQQRARKAEAEDTIAQDPNIVALQETMGAKILPKTTQPIDGESK